MSPLYNSQVITNSPMVTIKPGDTATLFNAETPLSGQNSIAVNVASGPDRVLRGLAFEFVFAAAPGAFNYRIQGSDTDADSSYFTPGTGTVTAVTVEADGTSRARVELSPWVAKFARVNINAQNANGVAVTVKVSAL